MNPNRKVVSPSQVGTIGKTTSNNQINYTRKPIVAQRLGGRASSHNLRNTNTKLFCIQIRDLFLNRYTETASMSKMQVSPIRQLRPDRSIIIRSAIELLPEMRRNNPKRDEV